MYHPQIQTKRNNASPYLVSNTWKMINQNQDSPLFSKIKVPRQTPSEVLGLGALCKNLDDKKIWKNGVLIRKTEPEDVIEDVEKMLVSMFKGMNHLLATEWSKPTRKKSKNKNWLLISYSMEIICKLFKDACLYFSSAKDFAEDWLIGDKPEDMMHKFRLAISEVIISEEYGFFRRKRYHKGR